tara:strand:- start:38512 stop:38940 length:429 start_codon:yes stop_codon:yes gene_type:complete
VWEVSTYGGLFLAAFLAATILPFSSEVAFTGAIMAGLDPVISLIVASAGNCLACSANYLGGYALGKPFLIKLLQKRRGRRIYRFVHRREAIALLLSWLPVVGDPITLAAGGLRTHPVLFHSIVWPLRILRYVALLIVFQDGQ